MDIAPEIPAFPSELAGRFEEQRLLGRGGMGLVYLVRDRRLNRQVALKVLLTREADLARAIEHEARILAQLENDHVVRLYDFGMAGGWPYLVMEYVRGVPLSVRMAWGRPTVMEAVTLARDVLRGLSAAHAQGIVHRDLKPANIFLEDSGRAKVADFGLALVEGEAQRQDAVMGTVAYMAPEQLEATEVDARADLFSTGVLLYELLTGERLFPGRTFTDTLVSRGRRPYPDPSRTNPAVPTILDQLVAKLLQTDPAARPPAHEVLASLEKWLEHARAHLRGRHPDNLPAEPYKSLQHFVAADAPVFFGRDRDIVELVDLLQHPRVRLLSVFGPCGVGKSSLLAAGLVPALDHLTQDVQILNAGQDPARAIRRWILERTNATGLEDSGIASRPGDPRNLGLADQLHRLAMRSRKTYILIIDQLEELFTLNPQRSPAIAAFFELVTTLVEADPLPVKLILGFRSEFRGNLFPLEERLGRFHRPVCVREMSAAGLEEAIQGPARHEVYGFGYEPGFTQRLAVELAERAAQEGEAALPRLQILCSQLYRRAKERQLAIIGASLYEGVMGGARGVLESYISERLGGAYGPNREIAQQMLKALTVRGEGGQRFSRPLPEEELVAFSDRQQARRTLERLIADHLVVREVGPDGEHQTRLASETMCPIIDRFLEERDGAERAGRALVRSLKLWKEHGGRPQEHLHGQVLTLVQTHLAALHDLTAEEQGFVATCARARRLSRLLQFFLSSTALLIMSFLIYRAYFESGEVYIKTNPGGVDVYLGNQQIGRTPFVWEASPNLYTLTLRKPPYAEAKLLVRVPAGGASDLETVLAYPSGILAVATDPADAICRVLTSQNRQLVSTLRTPFSTEVAAGTYLLKIEHPGYRTELTAPFRVEPNRSVTHRVIRLTR